MSLLGGRGIRNAYLEGKEYPCYPLEVLAPLHDLRWAVRKIEWEHVASERFLAKHLEDFDRYFMNHHDPFWDDFTYSETMGRVKIFLSALKTGEE
ncbi:hypothetical protein EKO27_g5830 [Xylaria grammica]|uniref:Uncharacterized protein n=1 Tax=Xylaria grammica TaxID=363999 RepID=A0A439D4F7_9PEZI|nr:hypothetical protein EKO27_g5830 [Xylaria grammica]